MTSLARHALCLATAVLLPLAPLPAQALAKRLDARLDAPGLDRLLWGVSVTDLDGHVLYSRNGDRLFVPASNTKILATVTATVLLGFFTFVLAAEVFATHDPFTAPLVPRTNRELWGCVPW